MMKTKQLNIPLKVSQLSASERDVDVWQVSGYATVWDNQNAYDFSIAKGAYQSLIEAGASPKMFFNHDAGDVPIGKWVELVEDDTGLKVVGTLTQGVSKAKDVYCALKDGTIDGLSVGIGFYEEDIEEAPDGTFSVLKISALPEISVCTYPADSKARVMQTLSVDEIDEKIEAIESLRDLEAFFKTLGLSKRQSGWLASKAKVAVAGGHGDHDAKELGALSDIFERIAHHVNTK